MSEYCPDKWVVVKITGHADNPVPVYKVFACWYGGYAGSDSWKLNSGITAAMFSENFYHFSGASGSVYKCHNEMYGTNMYGQSVLSKMISSAADAGVSVDIMPETTNWLEINYE